jgi:hypothetical protein
MPLAASFLPHCGGQRGRDDGVVVLCEVHARIIPAPSGHACDEMSELSLERSARNEVVFRDANEEIEARREELTAVAGRTPFLCECADPYCKAVIPLTLDEYEHVRAQSNRFVLQPGHLTAEAVVVEETDRFVMVEKQGLSRKIAQETDPRR